MTELLAFRAYGCFCWPPLPSSVPDERTARYGTVEIYYVNVGAELIAHCRWRPKRSEGVPAFPQPPPEQLIFTAPQRLVDLLNQPPETVLEFRLDNPDADPTRTRYWGARLLFRGASIFDQYRLDPDNTDLEPGAGDDSNLELRWMLARSFNQKNRLYFSEVAIGRSDDKPGTGGNSFAFNFALPTPTPQAVISGVPVNTFSFRARFRPRQPITAERAAIPLWRFAAGPDGGIATEPEIELPTLVAKHLGRFGFCRTDGGLNYLYLPRDPSNIDKYWLADTRVFIDHVLSRFGPISDYLGSRIEFAAQANPTGDTTSTGDEGEFWDSIGFVPGAAQHETIINFRHAIFARPKVATISDGVIGTYAPDASDLRLFRIKDPANPGKWIDTESADLLIDFELSYTIATNRIWAIVADPASLNPRLRIRLGFVSTLARRTGSNELDDAPGAGYASALFDAAIKGMRLARLGLRQVASVQPESILLDFVEFPTPDRSPRFALCAGADVAIAKTTSPVGDVPAISWSLPGETERGESLPDFRLTLWPSDPRRKIINKMNVAIAAKAILPSFDHAGADNSAAATPFDIVLSHDERAYDPASDHRVAFRLDHRAGTSLTGRIGGIEFETTDPVIYSPGLEQDAEYSHWRWGPRTRLTVPADPWRYWTADVDLRLRLDVNRVEPLGVDIPWGDRQQQARPLLIRVDPQGSGEGRYTLDARERLSEKSDWQLSATIIDRTPTKAPPGQYVVLSERPFSIIKFQSEPLQTRGNDETAAVAYYDSDTRAWRFRSVAPNYHFEFPPQSIGESMDKPRRLELHDTSGTTAGELEAPFIADENGVKRRRAVEFRLTPSAELWLRPGDLEQGYFLPEWALHQLFRQKDALGVGAAMTAFRGEFNYGLSVGIDTSQEVGAARSARVAEIEALLGRPPGEIDAGGNEDLRSRWHRVREAIERRPERLEFWMRDPHAATPLTPAKFAAGVRFALRRTAVHHPPVPGLDGAPNNDRIRLRPHGLRGGAIWPLESANFCRALMRAPDSNGGTIEKIALSPTGGDADQRAEFLNGQLAIISETRSGHVQRHRVEIIGRISVFWHRAKHVVVYERTVNPSAQFTPEGGLGMRTRRPVIRKVSEYIEVLQPVRTYPDMATASGESAGFLQAVRFNSKIINVDSAWSEEVGDVGFKIPLWNRRSARIRPSVYPRPDIAFVTAAEGEGVKPEAAQECLDPDNLFFFADAVAGHSDTDRWDTRVGLDFTNLPPPQHSDQPDIDDQNERSKLNERRKPSAPRIPRGHRRFSWRLALAQRRTAINAGRAGEPLFVGLDSITFMRSTGADTPRTELVRKKLDLAKQELAKDPLAGVRAVQTAANTFREVVKTGSDLDIQAAAGALAVALRSPDVGTSPFQGLKGLHELAGDGPTRCKKLVDDFSGSLQRKKLLVIEQIRAWERNTDGVFVKLGDQFPSKVELIDAVAGHAFIAVKPALFGVQKDLSKLGNSTEQARAMVRDFEADIFGALDRAGKRLDETIASYDYQKPWSLHRLEEYHERIASVRDGIAGDIAASVAEIQMRLASELDALANVIAVGLGGYYRSLVDGEQGLLTLLGQAESTASAYLLQVRDGLTSASGPNGSLTKLREGIAKAIEADKPGKYTAMLTGLRTRLDALEAQALDSFNKLSEVLRQSKDRLEQATEQTADLLKELLSQLNRYAVDAATELAAMTEAELAAIRDELIAGAGTLHTIADQAIDAAAQLGQKPDWMVARVRAMLAKALEEAGKLSSSAIKVIKDASGKIQAEIDKFETSVGDDKVRQIISDRVIRPAVDALISDVAYVDGAAITQELLTALRERVAQMSRLVESNLDALDTLARDEFAEIQAAATQLCDDLGASLAKAEELLDDYAGEAMKAANAIADEIDKAMADIAELRKLAGSFQEDMAKVGSELSNAQAAAAAYADRVFNAAGDLAKGDLASAPSNVLRLWAAAASAPALPNLDFARERLGYYYNEVNKYIDTTPAEAWFGRLGDELKAMGLSLPFDKIGEGLIPKDLSDFDIGRVFKNFGGLDLSRMFGGFKLPAGAKDGIKLTHAFDKKQFRAWVQIDIDLPLPGRKSLFAVGPFKLDVVDSRLVGLVRLEASKDGDRVEQTGRASFKTNIDAVISGQSMVTLEKIALNFERGSGLEVDFDPRNIKLNPSFRFIQETLGSIFPEEVGGLKIIKRDGVPVGVEHGFSMPPIDLMAGTSGVSNIQISNHFSLVAYPDFVISDRFSLSRPELPFLFSIFIIGGTGYVTVDCEYRPFKNQLMVVVEASVGGSAALGFAAGPVRGLVFITLSIALAYRKLIGQPGGGLTVSLVLLIAGNVSVAGIATVYIGLMLRMSYHDSGKIDGVGTLTIELRISRFFKLKVRQQVTKKLRDGQSQTTSSTSVSVETEGELEEARQKASKLLKARG